MTQETPSPIPPPQAPPLSSPVAAPGPVPQMAYYPLPLPAMPRRSGRSIFLKVVLAIFFFGSIAINVFLIGYLVMGGMKSLSSTTLEEGSGSQVVAVYPLSGMINERAASEFARFYQAVREEKNIKAVVLRIDSGGGGVASSDQIYQMVKSIRDDLNKPVVVSMGSMAASGGYYVAAPANEIWAEPTTVTGSIGVIAAWPVLKGMMEKVGIEPVVLRSTHADQWKAKENFLESPDAAVRKDVTEMLDQMQARFEDVVKQGRGSKIVTRKVAIATSQPSNPDPFNGRAYTAADANSLGLIDRIGYLHDAAGAAARLAGLTSPRVVRYVIRTSLMDMLGGGESESKANAGLRIDADTLDNLTAPRILMVWKP